MSIKYAKKSQIVFTTKINPSCITIFHILPPPSLTINRIPISLRLNNIPRHRRRRRRNTKSMFRNRYIKPGRSFPLQNSIILRPRILVRRKNQG
uniref:Uncharacterized protein n=1 Tax=Medicago truncatula TaxID=3880 RepID=I3T5E7_MEDTR|nr:unknown [Medicago truncatula]